MQIEFEFSPTDTIEFGVGQKEGEVVRYFLLPVDNTVQEALRGEVQTLLNDFSQKATAPQQYDPAEKYSSEEYLVLPTDHKLSASLVEFHEADVLQRSPPDLQLLRGALCYFMRGTDGKGRRLTALNRASQFKATLGKQRILMALVSDALRVTPDPIMQLNAGFDIVIDSEHVHIFRPASFKALGNVDEEVAQAVPQNVAAISRTASFVEWSNIGKYAASHPRAASLLASIRSQGFAEKLDEDALKVLCQSTGVKLDISGEHIAVPDDQILPFLEVIDRRRYEIGLVPDTPEQYKASSRTRVGGN